MSLDREVQQALEQAQDTTSALLWRRVCHDLGGPITVGLIASDDSALRSLRQAASAMAPEGVQWVEIPVDDDEPGASLGAEDRLLSCHIVAAATPYPRALGSQERHRLAAMTPVAPKQRSIVLVGRELLDRLSDHPEREAAEVLARAEAIGPDQWTVLPEGQFTTWLLPRVADRAALARVRREEVAALLLEGARTGLERTREGLAAELAEVDALQSAEDEALDEVRRDGRRTAAHVLAAVRRHTDALLVELRAFLTELERDVPDQAEAITHLAVLRRSLPHWLHHVVESWLTERLHRWRVELAADLDEVGVDRAVAARAELVVPSMAPGPVHADGSWSSRLGATAAMGGGAALLIAGLWFPALLALSGGLAWSAVGRTARDAESRRNVIDAAIEALRAMAGDAERLLSDQLDHVEGELTQLEGEAVTDHEAARRSIRERLEARHAELSGTLAEHESRLDVLSEMLGSLHADAKSDRSAQ